MEAYGLARGVSGGPQAVPREGPMVILKDLLSWPLSRARKQPMTPISRVSPIYNRGGGRHG